MNTENDMRTGTAARHLKEAREGVGSLQFFVAAMAAQLRDMQVKLGQVDVGVVAPLDQGDAVARIQAERDAAVEEAVTLRARIEDLEQQMASLKVDLERQQVTFADHHAAKQEIARLRAELDGAQEQQQQPSPPEAEDKTAQRKRWQIGR